MKQTMRILFVFLGCMAFTFADDVVSSWDDLEPCTVDMSILQWIQSQTPRSKEETVNVLLEYAARVELDEEYADRGLHRESAIRTVLDYGTTNDLPKLVPFASDHSKRVRFSAIHTYLEIAARSCDPERMIDFSEYVLKRPYESQDEYFSRGHLLSELSGFTWNTRVSPTVREAIAEYLRKSCHRDDVFAQSADSIRPRFDPGYATSMERRNIALKWNRSTNALPGIRNYFVGIQRQFFPMDAPPPDETAPASIQDPLPDAVEEAAPPAVAPVLSPVPDPAAETPQTPRTNHGTWWIAVLVLAVISGVVLKMRHR